MNNKLYETLMKNISSSLSNILNENAIINYTDIIDNFNKRYGVDTNKLKIYATVASDKSSSIPISPKYNETLESVHIIMLYTDNENNIKIQVETPYISEDANDVKNKWSLYRKNENGMQVPYKNSCNKTIALKTILKYLNKEEQEYIKYAVIAYEKLYDGYQNGKFGIPDWMK